MRSGESSEARAAVPWAPVLAAIAVALVLRIPAALQEPWIDEIWSWGLARTRAGLLDVFAIESSNSHALNTLWIRLAGDRGSFFVYRMPALVAGIACVPLAARIAARHGRASAIAAAWIAAVSFLGVVYSTEARGYAPMVLCSLLAYECAWTWLDGGRRAWLVATWICAAVGVLSQTLYVVGWAAIALAVVVRIARERRGARAAVAFLLVPAITFAAWWFVNVRHVFNAGAPPWDLGDVLAETASWSFGVPRAASAVVTAAVVAALVLVADARRLARLGDVTWIAPVGVVVAGSAATAVILRHEYLAPRYFLVPLAFWGLSLARVLGRAFDAGGASRVAAFAAFALFAAGNAAHLAPFLRVGRGEIGTLVQRMAERSTAQPIVVTGNYDFNVGALLEWHARALPAGRSAAYVPQRALGPQGPDFAVADQPRLGSEPSRSIQIGPHVYVLLGVSRHDGPSGADWAVYERAPR